MIPDELLVEIQPTVVQVLDHGVPLEQVLPDQVPVIDDITAPPCLPPHAVLDAQLPRPVLDLDEVDHLGRADDQVDLPAPALALRGDASAGEKVGVLEPEGRADELPQQKFAVPAARHVRRFFGGPDFLDLGPLPEPVDESHKAFSSPCSFPMRPAILPAPSRSIPVPLEVRSGAPRTALTRRRSAVSFSSAVAGKGRPKRRRGDSLVGVFDKLFGPVSRGRFAKDGRRRTPQGG